MRLVGVKDVFAAEELRTSVTSGQYRRLEQSFTAVDVRNVVLEWPYETHAALNADQQERSHSKPWHQLRKGGQTGEERNMFCLVIYTNHRRRSSVNFEGGDKTFLPKNMCMKN